MSAYANAIADIGETLISLLQEGLSEEVQDKNSIILYSPGEILVGNAPSIRLCLFLYQVFENSLMKNREMERINEEKLRYPGLILDLHYMMIPYESTQEPNLTDRTVSDHRVLGRAMQIFHDNAVLRDPVLKGGLAGSGQEFRLVLNPVPIDEMTKIWQAFQTKPFRPAVCYTVTPVVIESAREQYSKRVTQSEAHYYDKRQ